MLPMIRVKRYFLLLQILPHISEKIDYIELHLNFAGKVKKSSCQRRCSAYLGN
jgi:hypothetical protein